MKAKSLYWYGGCVCVVVLYLAEKIGVCRLWFKKEIRIIKPWYPREVFLDLPHPLLYVISQVNQHYHIVYNNFNPSKVWNWYDAKNVSKQRRQILAGKKCSSDKKKGYGPKSGTYPCLNTIVQINKKSTFLVYIASAKWHKCIMIHNTPWQECLMRNLTQMCHEISHNTPDECIMRNFMSRVPQKWHVYGYKAHCIMTCRSQNTSSMHTRWLKI